MLKIAKFGGSSCASAEQFRKVREIVAAEESRRFIVVSAPGKRDAKDTKVTDLLYQLYEAAEQRDSVDRLLTRIEERYQDIIGGLGIDFSLHEDFAEIRRQLEDGASRDYAASRGEYLNAKLMAAYLGFPFVDAAELITFHSDGSCDFERTAERTEAVLRELDCAVVPGFYGADSAGNTVTFSRGGSDVTGSLLAAALHADLYENWTDVSGFLVADPRIVKQPEVIDYITYRELRELSYMGAGVLHEDAIFPVRREGIPIQIRNTNRPEDHGTMIVANTLKKPRFVITGIAGKKNFCSINIEKAMMNSEIGFIRKVLSVIEENGISVEHTPSGIDTLTLFIHQEELEHHEQKVLQGIQRTVNPDLIELEADLALIAVVGRGMKSARGVAGRVFSALAHEYINIKMIDQGSSEYNIIVGVRNEDFDAAIKAIYNMFVLSAK
ncbi:aspartate kinase [Oribacterium sp. oral taxon 102]|uniref:aspartate kinase n=1 Tax=Oribacterium sp. oral taxon 102 TaxID=671214 RepID=UPI0015BC5DD6|nr:aspartate kinase [Oribacterium sp. oral taxon 102]NWO21507.1 aspartate kinase [Oribacterium sp. oral taxon 102]